MGKFLTFRIKLRRIKGPFTVSYLPIMLDLGLTAGSSTLWRDTEPLHLSSIRSFMLSLVFTMSLGLLSIFILRSILSRKENHLESISLPRAAGLKAYFQMRLKVSQDPLILEKST